MTAAGNCQLFNSRRDRLFQWQTAVSEEATKCERLCGVGVSHFVGASVKPRRCISHAIYQLTPSGRRLVSDGKLAAPRFTTPFGAVDAPPVFDVLSARPSGPQTSPAASSRLVSERPHRPLSARPISPTHHALS